MRHIVSDIILSSFVIRSSRYVCISYYKSKCVCIVLMCTYMYISMIYPLLFVYIHIFVYITSPVSLDT